MALAPRIPGWPQNDLLEKEYWEKRPGFAESMVPVWGSAREAVADYHDGDYLGPAINGGLAVSDVFLASALAKGLVKTGAKGSLFLATKDVGGDYSWKNVRKVLGENRTAAKGQDVHHWLLHQNEGLGKYAPEWLKNQPWNLKPMQSKEIHQRIHSAYKGQPRFNAIDRYRYGVPTGAKVVQGVAVGHGVAGVGAQLGDDE